MQADRFGTLAVATTVAIMFVVVIVVVPLLTSLSTTYKAAATIAGVFGSMALYRGIAALLFAAFRKNLKLRKFILGPAFLEGTWVGYFPHGDSYHFTVEFFDHETGETKITGREIDADGKTYASWKSYASSIDTDNRRLIYAYSCDVYGRDRQQQGLGVFDMVGQGKRSPPTILDGYAADLVDGEKDTNKEHKISDELVADDDAIKEAKRIFLGQQADSAV